MLPHTESHTQSETFDATNTPSSAHLIEMKKMARGGGVQKCERDSSFDMQILLGFLRGFSVPTTEHFMREKRLKCCILMFI